MPKVSLTPTTPDTLVTIGPTIDVQIGFDPAYRPNLGLSAALPTTLYSALVDTGALESCIDAELASALQLIVVDHRWISGAGGPVEVNIYSAQIVIPSLSATIYGEFAGVNLLAGGQQHVALIGRTFLLHCELVYDGRTGTVTITNP